MTSHLDSFTNAQLEHELLRRTCAAVGHPPYSWAVIQDMTGRATAAQGNCQCGEQGWRAEKIGD